MAKKLRKKQTTKALIGELKQKARSTKQAFWRDIAKRLEKPRRIRPCVNIEKLEKLSAKYGDKLFIVPGKVLGEGKLSKAIRVCALMFSSKAREEITKNKGTAYTLKELVNMDVKGNEVFIVQ